MNSECRWFNTWRTSVAEGSYSCFNQLYSSIIVSSCWTFLTEDCNSPQHWLINWVDFSFSLTEIKLPEQHQLLLSKRQMLGIFSKARSVLCFRAGSFSMSNLFHPLLKLTLWLSHSCQIPERLTVSGWESVYTTGRVCCERCFCVFMCVSLDLFVFVLLQKNLKGEAKYSKKPWQSSILIFKNLLNITYL